MSKIIRLTVVSTVALLGLGVLAQQQPKPDEVPLGDVVKQQKAAKKAKRVITDDDMPARPPEPAPATAASGSGAASSETKSEAEPKGESGGKAADAKPAAAKSPEAQAHEKRIADLKYAEEAEKKTIQKMEDALAGPEVTDNRRRMYEDTLSHARELLGQFQKEREELEKQGAAAKPPATPK